MNDENEKDLLYGKMNRILEQYENPYSRKHYLYPRLKKLIKKFDDCKYINPEYYKELANLTEKIDFGCNFTNGKCENGRKKGCCGSCRWAFGYLNPRFINGKDTIKDIKKEMIYYATKFHRFNGFWRRNKGCILPREKRSTTCLTHSCKGNFDSYQGLLLNTLSNARREKFPRTIKDIIFILKEHFNTKK